MPWRPLKSWKKRDDLDVKKLIFAPLALGFILIGCVLQGGSAAIGQPISTEVEADSLQNAFSPALGYNSDLGLMGGGLYSRYDYRGNTEPFRSFFQVFALVSTRGYVDTEIRYERPRSLNSDIRSDLSLYVNRYKYDSYFGRGNETTFEEQRWEEDYYYFESVGFGLDYRGRKPLLQSDEGQMDLIGGAGIKYEIPYVLNEESSFAEDIPEGNRGGWVNTLNAGVLWENRNSEFNPTRGNRGEVVFTVAGPWSLSDYKMGTLEADFRQYIPFFNRITVAARVNFYHSMGEVPYWEQAAIGDSESLRGYPYNRFMDRTSLSWNLEMRTWILEFPDYGIKLGGQLFTDFGRVFGRDDDLLTDFFSDYKQTFGAGGAISLFSPDFILRGDLGFSEDMFRIYAGIGYVF